MMGEAKSACVLITKENNSRDDIESKSLVQNKGNVFYCRPMKTKPFLPYKPYKKPTIGFESTTTYCSSYKNNIGFARQKPVIPEQGKLLKDTLGTFDMSTTNNMSYNSKIGTPARLIVPRTHLGTSNCINLMSTTYRRSYLATGGEKSAECKPSLGIVKEPVMMECGTVMKESYQMPNICNLKTPCKDTRFSIQDRIKIPVSDYNTIYRTSYEKIPLKAHPKRQRKYLSFGTIECDTTYKSSYMIPAHCVLQEAINKQSPRQDFDYPKASL